VSCGAVHSQARELVRQGYTAMLVAKTLPINRFSLYHRKRWRGTRAGRTYYEQIMMACGVKPAYGHRPVAWWLQRKKGLPEKNSPWSCASINLLPTDNPGYIVVRPVAKVIWKYAAFR
jgi:hypothetical protein